MHDQVKDLQDQAEAETYFAVSECALQALIEARILNVTHCYGLRGVYLKI